MTSAKVYDVTKSARSLTCPKALFRDSKAPVHHMRVRAHVCSRMRARAQANASGDGERRCCRCRPSQMRKKRRCMRAHTGRHGNEEDAHHCWML